MKKIKYLICMMVLFCAMSTVSYAKQVVRYSSIQDGSEEKPFSLTLGESLIDVYYADEKAAEDKKETYKDFYFKFGSSIQGVNAANYLVEHNSDKHRVRFTLIGTTEQDLQVASSRGLNYFQAGAKTVVQNKEDLKTGDGNGKEANDLKTDIQIPFYTINAKEYFNNEFFQHNVTLSNGFLKVDSVVGANVATYSTSYVFAKSGVDFNSIYTVTQEQISRKSKINFLEKGRYYFENENKIVSSSNTNETHTLSGSVEIIYQFNTTHSELGDAEGEQAPLIERILSKILLAFGDAMVTITQLGKNGKENGHSLFVTVDSLVFNEYPKTIVDLWGETGSINAISKNVVNFWFKVFYAWAVVIYVIMLVYMGIKTVLVSGTPKQKEIRPMLEGWIIGLLMLLIIPVLCKYVIKINDTLVDVIRTNSKYSIYAYYTFEDEYKSLGGKQDGEDSMTSIVDRLTNAKTELQKDVEELEGYIDAFDEGYEEALSNLQDSQKNKAQRETAVKARLNNLDALYTKGTNYQFMKDGQAMSVDQIYNELFSITSDYMKDKEYYNTETKEFDPSVEDGLKQIIEEYSNKYMVCYPDGREADKQLNGEPMSKWEDGTMWYTHFLRQDIYNSVFGLPSSGDAFMLQIYEEEAWVKYYENERDKYKAEQTEKQEKIYAIEKAIERAEESDVDLTGMMRTRAGSSGKIMYVLAWLMLVFQVILLLILYYKRLFMIVVLVAVFPLVALAYAYEKTKGTKGSIFRNWIQEYLINVFIQSIHAILYVVLVELGYTIFIADGDNWLFFVIATWALVFAEPIFKKLIGLKGNATLKGLADYAKSADTIGLAGISAVAGVIGTAKDIGEIDDQSRNREAEIEKKNAKKDNKTNIKRKEQENEIKRKYGADSEQGKKLLEEKEKREEKEDKKKAEKRKRAIKRRRNATRARMVGRVAGNLGQIGVAATAALATGNEGTFGSVQAGLGELRRIEGGGLTEDAKAREARLEEEAEKAKEAKKANSTTKLGNVETETAEDDKQKPVPGRNNSNTYDNAGEGGYEGKPIIREHTKTFETYKQRLKEQRAYTEEKWNITEKDDE